MWKKIINQANNELYKEDPTYIYETIEITLIFSEIADIAETTYNEGKLI